MMDDNRSIQCLNDKALMEFNSGELEESNQSSQILDHLESCEKCSSRLRRIREEEANRLEAGPQVLENEDEGHTSRLASSKASSQPDRAVDDTEQLVPLSNESTSARQRALPIEFDKYFVIKQIGKGGFANVYLAKDPEYNRLVAIKVPNEKFLATEEHRETFLSEARTVAQLDHPNIVPVYDYRVFPECIGIVVMQFIKGQSLQERMAQERLSLTESLTLVASIAEALECAHQEQIFHRDVKPANILLSEKRVPFLTDFGLAFHEEQRHRSEFALAGTIPYMSPEQILAQNISLDGRSDIWSLGVVLYELLTNKRPFNGSDLDEYIDEIVEKPHRAVQSHNASIPDEVSQIVDRCLEKDVNRRYASAAQLANEIRSCRCLRNLFSRRNLIVGLGIPAAVAALGVPIYLSSRNDDEPANGVSLADFRKLVWEPNNDLTDTLEYSPETRELRFDTLSRTLLQIGTIHSKETEISTKGRIEGVDRVGFLGLFWAWGTVGEEAKSRYEEVDYCCWSICFGREFKRSPFSPEKIQRFRIDIEQLLIGPTGSRHIVFHTHSVDSIRCSTNYTDPRISIVVTPTELREVRLNGERLNPNTIALESQTGIAWTKLKDTVFGVFGNAGSLRFFDIAQDD